jgi:hypothetical protein
MLPDTATRVHQQTDQQVNEAIERSTAADFARRAGGGPEEIDQGIRELEQEWDIERTLQTNFAIVNLVGIALGALVDRRWYLFSAAATGFMVQHALQGWCPPVPIFRRLGYRTAAEINRERYALKAVRGDFDSLGAGGTPNSGARNLARNALQAAQRG